MAWVAAVALLAGGCGGVSAQSGASPAPSSRPSTSATAAVAATEALAAIDGGATVIDVRTPAEYASGHLRDARNLDLSADDFERRVRRLDPDAAYVVYCASGRRAGEAVALMLDAGFSDVLNGGGYEDLAAAGAPVVRGGR